jgi:hypothetical protein
LQGRTEALGSLNSAPFAEVDWLARVNAMGLLSGRCLHGTFKTELHYLNEDYEAALQMAEAAERTAGSSLGMHWTTDLPFYTSLALAARAGSGPLSPADAETLARQVTTLATLAQSYPANAQHRHQLVLAELARLGGEPAKQVGALYEQAIASARDSGFGQHEALANELCAKYHLAQGRGKLAALYLRVARYDYERWGATGKVGQLTHKFGELLSEPELTSDKRTLRDKGADTITTLWVPGQRFDVSSVLRAAQAISSEIVLDKVLARVMGIVLANAGAQRGFLVLLREGSLWIEATATLDPERVEVDLKTPLASCTELAVRVVHYVARSREPVVLIAHSSSHGSRLGSTWRSTARSSSRPAAAANRSSWCARADT